MTPAPIDDRRSSGGADPSPRRRLATALGNAAWRLLPAEVRDDLRTELDIEYRAHIRPARGEWAARRWYARQFLGSLLWHLTSGRTAPIRPHEKGPLMDSLLADLRFAMRSFRRTRGLTALAVLTIALGVGASTAVFSVLNTVVLQPLPYPAAERIVEFWHDGVITKAVMSRFMERTRSLETVAGTIPSRRTLTGDFDPEELTGLEVTGSYWELFGARPVLGTLPSDRDTDPGQAPVVVISHRLWQRKFGGDPDLVGKTVRLNGRATTVVGVLEGSFVPVGRSTDFWMPMEIDTSDFSDYQGVAQVSVYGRLAEGIDLEAARADARVNAAMEREAAPDAYSERWVARAAPVPLHDVLVQDASAALWATLGAVLLVLMIACANVANLLLARSGSRQREIAVRIGLGAGRARIVRQLLTESLLLALGGGALGSVLAAVAINSFGSAWAELLPRTGALAVDADMLGFALVTTLAASLAFGLAPALRASAVAPREQFADGANAGVSKRNRRLSDALVGLEVALSVLLVIGASLMLRTVGELVSIDPGFDAEGVTVFRVRIPEAAEGAEAMPPPLYVQQVRESLAALPAIDTVAAVTFPPMAWTTPNAVYWVQGRERPEDQPPDNANFQLVSGDYFGALGIPLIRGRTLEASDADGEYLVAVINETMARTAFPDDDPIGQRITMFGGTDMEIVGVVGDTRQRSPDQTPEPEVFMPFERVPFWPTIHFVLRSAGPPPSAASIRAAVWEVDAAVPVLDLSAMDEVVARASGRTRLFARTLTGFGILALALAATGVYGVTRHALVRQVREFGIRLAIGATPGTIVRTAVVRSVPPVVIGAGVGVIAAGALSGLLRGRLYGVSPTDPMTYVAVPALLVIVGTLAAFLPARRAAAVDPKESLNPE